MSLVDDAAEQYIDNSGKMRMLNFSFKGKGVSLMIPPSPPVDLPYSSRVYTIKLETALSFIKEHDLTILFQDLKDQKLKGLWVTKDDKDCYIPVRSSKELENVEIADYSRMRPLLAPEESLLEKYRKSSKVADFLKKYTLYTYSLNPEAFGRKSFIIKPEHEYKIETLNNKLFVEGNDVFYENLKLIVKSKKTRDKLLAYLKVQILNDKQTILNLKNVTTLDEGYKSTRDFIPFPNQLVFNSSNEIRKWKEELKRLPKINNVSLTPLSNTKEPYFYRLAKTDKIVIIQNVENGKLETAINVSHKWIKDKINKGFYPFESTELTSPENVSYIAFTDKTDIKYKKETKEYVPLFFYENGDYAAILNLEDAK